MNGFETVFRGYNKEQVKSYLDYVIKKYEELLNEKKAGDLKIQALEDKLEHYVNIEDTLNHAIFTAENAGDHVKKIAREEAQSLIDEAKRNANHIINDALLKAEKAQMEADKLKRNVIIYKNRLKSIIESQLDIIDEIEKIEIDGE